MKWQRKISASFVALILAGGLGIAHAGDSDVDISYKVGKGLTIESPSNPYKLNISANVQPRFTYMGLEDAPDTNTFAVQRGQVNLAGYVFKKSINYGFQMNLSSTNGGNAVLDDYFVDWIPYTEFGIKVGQFKVPFVMQDINSDKKLQFVDRSLTTGFFGLGRDVGVSFHGSVFDELMNYYVFGFNGDGPNVVNTNQGIMAGARVEFNLMGKYEATESDVDDSQDPNFGVGVAYALTDSYNSRPGRNSQNGTIPLGTVASSGTLDAGLRYQGFSVAAGGMLTRSHGITPRTNIGYNVQFGYFFVPKRFEIAFKQGSNFFSDAARNQHEYSAGFNYFIKGHPIKFQTDYALLDNNRGFHLSDHRVRTQLQVNF